MSRFTSFFLFTGALALSACSVTTKSGHNKEDDPPAPSEDIQHFLAQPTPGANVTWKGFCQQKPEVEVDMQLVADGHYTVSSSPASAFTTESGVYRAAGDAVTFFDAIGMMQNMSCSVEANVKGASWSVAKGLSCALSTDSKVSFFGGCSLIKFARVEDIKAPDEPKCNNETCPHVGSVSIVLGPEKPVATHGSLALSLAGTCEDKKTPVKLSLDKTGAFSVKASPDEDNLGMEQALSGQYYKADAAGTYKFFVSNTDGQPVTDNADMSCSGPNSADGRGDYSCIVKNPAFTTLSGCHTLTLKTL